jgi:hypothetical protein
MDADAGEGIGRNEATSRRINEAIEAGRVTRGGLVGFFCVCSRLGCNEVVELTIAEYEAVRGSARQFFVAGEHASAGEAVVDVRDRYWVIRKCGEAGEVAERADPRVEPDAMGS